MEKGLTQYELKLRQKIIEDDNTNAYTYSEYEYYVDDEGTADDIAAECYKLDRVSCTRLEGILHEAVE